MNRRSFFKGLAAVFVAAITPFKAKAVSASASRWSITFRDGHEPDWLQSYVKFLNTPHADRIDWEHLDSSDLWGFEEGVLPKIKAGADASARKRLELDSKLEPTYLLPSDAGRHQYYGWCGRHIGRGAQTQFADGRPWAPLRDDLRAAFRAARNNPVADTGAVQGTSDRILA